MVELLGYNPRARAVLDVLHFFGNGLTSGAIGFDNDDFLSRMEQLDGVVDGGNVSVSLRGQQMPLIATPGERMVNALRRFAAGPRDLLLATEDELRGRIPADLPEILALDEWHQQVCAVGPRGSSQDRRPTAASDRGTPR